MRDSAAFHARSCVGHSLGVAGGGRAGVAGGHHARSRGRGRQQTHVDAGRPKQLDVPVVGESKWHALLEERGNGVVRFKTPRKKKGAGMCDGPLARPEQCLGQRRLVG